MDRKKGIGIAGNLIVDHVKMIDRWPEKGMLCNISDEYRSIGGCAGNTAVDLAEIDSSIPLFCYGCTGLDLDGDFVLEELKKRNINTHNVRRIEKTSTSYTDVMTEKDTGERTFFQKRGANAQFLVTDEMIRTMQVKIFHVGYLLLLDRLDQKDDTYGTVMAGTLARIQERGIKTSIDIVSEQGERFKKIVTPALRYCNYFIANEIESGMITEIEARDESDRLVIARIREILKAILEKGVKDLAVIHAPEGGYAMSASGAFEFCPSFYLPAGFIKGSVGAGDAFCAGMLYALYQNEPVKEALEFANLAAACCLSGEDSVSGMRSLAQMTKLRKELQR